MEELFDIVHGQNWELHLDKVDEPVGEDDDEEPQRKKRGGNVEPVIPVIPTDRVEQLLESLEFNEVNMYRYYVCFFLISSLII